MKTPKIYNVHQAMDELEKTKDFLRDIRNICDSNIKKYPHKAAENYAYWDIQDRIDRFFGEGENL